MQKFFSIWLNIGKTNFDQGRYSYEVQLHRQGTLTRYLKWNTLFALKQALGTILIITVHGTYKVGLRAEHYSKRVAS